MAQIRLYKAGGVITLLLALVSAADASYLLAKAALAQQLIARAWDKSLSHNGKPHKPWPWADTVVVARLSVAAAGLDTWVLEGSSGTSLAFGPGMVAGSAAPGDKGLVVIGAHRDTHFKDLKSVAKNDIIRLQDATQQWHKYRVSHIDIADIRTDKINTSEDKARLLLITCFPFDAILPGGPLRYVIEAELVNDVA